MPFEMPGHWYDPKVFYFEPSQMTADPGWTSKITSSEIETGTAVFYESRTDFDSFYPMEIPMTSEERGKFIKGLPFVAVTESRIRSVRMKNELPIIWCDRSEDELTVLHDKVCRNEHYVFQIAVCAEEKLENVKVVFTDINNRAIGSDDCICFNLDGRDADGNIIKIQRDADKGEVLPLWCGLRAENFTGKKLRLTLK